MIKTRFWPRVVAAFASGTIAFAGVAGCSMCCGPYDYHYPTFGGRVQRADPEYGRVGSIFSDPYTAGTGLNADSNVKKLDPPKSNNREDSTEPAINRETSPLPRPLGDERDSTDPNKKTSTAGDRETENQWHGRQKNQPRRQWR